MLFYAAPVLMPGLERELGLSHEAAAGAFSFALGVAALASLSAGRLVDAGRARALMAGGAVLGAASLAFLSRAHSFPWLLAGFGGIGLAMAAALYEPAFAVVSGWYPDSRARLRALSVVTIVGAFASGVFVPVTRHLVETFGWRGAFLGLAAIALGFVAPANAIVLRGARASRPPRPPGDPAPSLAHLVGRPGFVPLAVATFLSSLAAVGLIGNILSVLAGRGLGLADGAHALALFGVSQVPSRFLYPALHRRAGWRGAATLALVLEALGALVLAAAHTTAPALLGAALFGFGNGLVTLARAAGAPEIAPDSYAATGGALGGTASAARAIGPFAVAAASARLGPTPVFLALAVGLLAALLPLRRRAAA